MLAPAAPVFDVLRCFMKPTDRYCVDCAVSRQRACRCFVQTTQQVMLHRCHEVWRSLDSRQRVSSHHKASAAKAMCSSSTKSYQARRRKVPMSARSVQQPCSWEALKHAKQLKDKFEQLPHQLASSTFAGTKQYLASLVCTGAGYASQRFPILQIRALLWLQGVAWLA